MKVYTQPHQNDFLIWKKKEGGYITFKSSFSEYNLFQVFDEQMFSKYHADWFNEKGVSTISNNLIFWTFCDSKLLKLHLRIASITL